VAIVGSSAIRVDTDAQLAFWASFLAPEGAPFALGGGTVSFFVRAQNPNPGGWQGQFPRLELVDAEGKNRFVSPQSNFLDEAQGDWIYVTIPVSGQPPAWTVADGGVSLGAVVRINFYADTFGDLPYTLWFDGLTVITP
jgi:hypothetical protein